ncbi:MAG TPA: glycerophosphodiester phosphodiesterase family protein [Methanoregulaceae archaeon]|nr:glycerophosphodiester phosphodiesterase family protein [Methanoregulaceae archaeon]
MWIIGHRGAQAEEPENTLRSVRKGYECADFVEVDVRLSHDGIPVVIHDAKLDRTTSGTGRVNDHTLKELRVLDAGEGETIPTLSEIMALVKGKCGIFIEIKEPGSEQAVCSLLGTDPADDVFIVSFHEESLRTVKNLLSWVKTGYIFSEPNDNPVSRAVSLRADAIIPRLDRLSSDLIEIAHRNRIIVIPWTPNTPHEIRKAIKLGADGIITDNPCMAKHFLKEARGPGHSS